jgi:hypothetical protein
VPPPPPKEPKLRIEKADPYDVRYEAEAPGLARQADPMFFSPSSFRNVEAAGEARPRLPRWPLLTGVLLFLAYRQAIIRWIVLSVVLAIVLLLAGGAVTLTPPALPAGNRGSALVGAAGTNILQLIMTAAAVVLGAMWGVAASINLLAIAQDTSSGNDEIENWPEEVFLDWFPNAFFVIDSFLLSVVPGVAIVWFRPELAGAGVLLVLSSLLFLFPIALLSMSEAGSPLLPFSARVLRSLVRCPGTWLMFYFETGLLVFAAVLGLASLLFGGVLMLLPVSALLVLVMMLYFRLLGRLAWACGSSAADADDRQPA